ncbi:MAG TPA: IclR family transcriptional regulator [Kineosporiaceae bacterium]|nr:IclR family transcriptional regulator [Kineosporiaceae bacterium]
MSKEPSVAAAELSGEGGGIREVKSAARTVDLLELMAARGNEPARLRELSDALGAPRSSIYALLRTLVERGWVRTDATGTLYSIGIQALLAGTTYLDFDPFLRIVQPQINELSVKLDETIHYGRLQGARIVYLATHESSQYLRPFSRVGRTLPAFSTAMGKSLLAERLHAGDPDSLAEHLPDTLAPLTAHTIVDRLALARDLEAVRSRGYAVDREENLEGVVCFAVVLRFASPPSDAISCSLPVERLREGREAEIIEALRRTKLTIERMAPAASLREQPWV